jgi:hypothetical protein
MFVSKPDRFSSDIIMPGRVHDDDGFITENRVIEGLTGPITIYFSVAGLRQLAARYPQLELVRTSDAMAALDEAEALREEVQRLQARVEELEANEERIIGLRKAGFTVQRKMGAPKKKEVAA